MSIRLHGFFRSSASWRVRIALALKGIEYSQVAYKLRDDEQRSSAFLAINPQGLVPVLEIDGLVLSQSLAIIDYLEARNPEPSVLGSSASQRAQILSFALAIACDTHPLQNLRVLKAIQGLTASEAAAQEWARQVNYDGLSACAALLPKANTRFCFGNTPSLADICLVPQMANARRFGVSMNWGRLEEIEAHCLANSAFAETAPGKQPDATD